MKIVQVDLKRESPNGLIYTMTSWLDSRPDLVEGIFVTLKDMSPGDMWKVIKVHPGEHEAKDFDFHRKWDNNNYDKHKGLGIASS